MHIYCNRINHRGLCCTLSARTLRREAAVAHLIGPDHAPSFSASTKTTGAPADFILGSSSSRRRGVSLLLVRAVGPDRIDLDTEGAVDAVQDVEPEALHLGQIDGRYADRLPENRRSERAERDTYLRPLLSGLERRAA